MSSLADMVKNIDARLVGIRIGDQTYYYVKNPSLANEFREAAFELVVKDPDDIRAIATVIGQNANIAITGTDEQSYRRWKMAGQIIRRIAKMDAHSYGVVKQNLDNAVGQIMQGKNKLFGLINIKTIFEQNISNIIFEIMFGSDMSADDRATVDSFSKNIVAALMFAQLNPSKQITEWIDYPKSSELRKLMVAMFRSRIELLFANNIREGQLQVDDYQRKGSIMEEQVLALVEGGITDLQEIIDLISDNLIVAVLAGTHTTFNALTSMVSNLQDEHVDNIANEVRALFGERDFTPEEIFKAAQNPGKLAYLLRWVHESFRLNSSVVRRTVQQTTTDLIIDGCLLPSGSKVLLPIHDFGQLQWTDPQRFRPERFKYLSTFTYSQADEKGELSHKPFEVGPRKCPGATMAMVEIMYLIAKLSVELQQNGLGLRSAINIGMDAANIQQSQMHLVQIREA